MVEHSPLSHGIDRQTREIMVELAALELRDEARYARVLSAQPRREQAHRVALHRQGPRLQSHQPVSQHRAVDCEPLGDALLLHEL